MSAPNDQRPDAHDVGEETAQKPMPEIISGAVDPLLSMVTTRSPDHPEYVAGAQAAVVAIEQASPEAIGQMFGLSLSRIADDASPDLDQAKEHVQMALAHLQAHRDAIADVKKDN